MKDWGGAFDFESPYDIAGAPQGARASEIEAIVEDLHSAIRVLGLGDEGRRRLELAASRLLNEARREALDARPETRLLATQDPFPQQDLGLEGQLRLVEQLLGDEGVGLRDVSRLGGRGRGAR